LRPTLFSGKVCYIRSGCFCDGRQAKPAWLRYAAAEAGQARMLRLPLDGPADREPGFVRFGSLHPILIYRRIGTTDCRFFPSPPAAEQSQQLEKNMAMREKTPDCGLLGACSHVRAGRRRLPAGY